jgi:hypothetical protein
MGKMLSYTLQTLRIACLISVITVYYHIIRILIYYIVRCKNVTTESVKQNSGQIRIFLFPPIVV